MKRIFFLLVGLVGLGLLLRFWWQKGQSSDGAATVSHRQAIDVSAAPTPSAVGGSTTRAEADGPILLAKELNAPGSTIQKDLRIVEDLLDAYRSNLPHGGNPVGENVEIAANLSGKNPLHLVLIPKDHTAFNAEGELCDRWGTPFRFHALSSTQMEVRSAGPDKKFGTADDAILTP